MQPVFAIYNFNFALKQTDINRNNESALSNLTLLISGCLGLFIGVWLLEKEFFYAAVMIGCVGGTLATYIMYAPLPYKNYTKRTRVRLGWRKPSNRLTLITSMSGILIDSCRPIWMNVIGISPLSTGINMALHPFLGMLIMPLFAFLMRRGTYQTSRYISGFLVSGWFMAPLLFPILGFSVGETFTYALIYRRRNWKDRLMFWQRPVFVAEAIAKE